MNNRTQRSDCILAHMQAITRSPIFIAAFIGVDVKSLGIPTEMEIVQEYCRRMNIPMIENWDFYVAFNFFRFAAILQGVYKRAVTGK